MILRQTHHLGRLATSLIRPQRCVFVDPTDRGGERASSDARTKAREQILRATSEAAAKTKFDEMKDIGVLKEEDRSEILTAWRTAHPQQTGGEQEAPANNNDAASRKLDSDIEKIQQIDTQALAKKLKESVDNTYINNLAQLRNAVRQELVNLGIAPDKQAIVKLEKTIVSSDMSTKEKKRIRLVRGLQKDISTLVAGLIDEGGTTDRHQRSLRQSIVVTDRMRSKCMQVAKDIFGEANREKFTSFLDLLESQNFPPQGGQQGGAAIDLAFIKNLREFKQHIRTTNLSDEEALSDFLGGANLEPAAFLQRLQTIKTIFEHFNRAEKTPSAAIVFGRLEDLLQKSRSLKSAIDLHPEWIDEKPELASLADAAAFADMTQTIEYLRKENAHPRATEQQRAFATGYADFLEQQFDTINNLIEGMEGADESTHPIEIKAGTTKVKVPSPTPEGEELHVAEGDEKKHEPRFIKRVGDKIGAVTSLGGKVTWYSWANLKGDFDDFWKLVKGDFEDKQGDKTGGLKGAAANLWNDDVAQRNKEGFAAWLQKESSDRWKKYEYWSKGEILNELERNKISATRMALVLALAQRGLLRWSDKDLVNRVCKAAGIDTPTDDQWENAFEKIDQNEIKAKLMEAGDALAFGKYRFGEQLIDTQRGAVAKQEDEGAKLGSAAESASPTAEIKRLANIIKESGLEGDAKIVGLLRTMIKRGNMNGGKNPFYYKSEVDGEEKTISTPSLNMGFVTMMVIDSYLQGRLSSEAIFTLSSHGDSAYSPFSILKSMLVTRKKRESGGEVRHTTEFEEWGWVTPTGLTALGQSEIVKFFNSRNAIAKIGGKEKMVHLGNEKDAREYVNKSSNRDPNYIRSLGQSNIGAKVLSNDLKATDLGAFKEIFEKTRMESSVQIEQLMAIIKSGTEDFMDGAQQAFEANGSYERYIRNEGDDKGKEISAAEYHAKIVESPDAASEYTPIGYSRMQRGRKILTIVFQEVSKKALLQENPVYTITDSIADPAYANKPLTLDKFIEATIGHTATYARSNFSSTACERVNAEVQQIMQGFRTYKDRPEESARAA